MECRAEPYVALHPHYGAVHLTLLAAWLSQLSAVTGILVAPVKIGKGAHIGSGSVITRTCLTMRWRWSGARRTIAWARRSGIAR
jgi:hypothetical protein